MPRLVRRRLGVLGSLLVLSGCSGLGVFLDDTHSATGHVNRPIGDSETMLRVEGKPATTQVLAPEPGNVWPGPVPPPPTLEDLQNLPAKAPSMEGIAPPSFATVPNLVVPEIPHHLQPHLGGYGTDALSGPLAPGAGSPPSAPSLPAAPPPASPQGTIAHTPRGNAVSTRTPSGIPQADVPTNPGAITVPNGNGTSTVIAPDGTITTIPAPR